MSHAPQVVATTWWEDQPDRLARELDAMRAVAPNLAWTPALPGGGWVGTVPSWPFDRPRPHGLTALLDPPELAVQIACGHPFPMIEPSVRPTSVTPPIEALGWTAWHVTPDGRLCLLQTHADWDPADNVASVIGKMAGWYVEFQLMQRGLIAAMTEAGIETDTSLDALLDAYPNAVGGDGA